MQRRRVEAALRESEQRFATLAEGSPVLLWVNGPAGNEFVNRAYREFVGVDSDEEISGYGWSRFVHPADRDEYLNAYQRALAVQANFTGEFRFRRFDGKYRWMRSDATPRLGDDGELIGYGANSDAHHVAAPAPEHRGAQACFRLALKDARIDPSAVQYINAHGTSTDLNDKNETFATKVVFGDHARKLAMSSTKSMTGHTLGAAGGIEAGITALAIARGVLPPTTNYTTPDPECDLDYVPNEARRAQVEVALSNAMGLGGHNGCVLLRRAA